jgi:MFS family permease
VIVIWWSIFTSMTALAYSAWSMMAVRFLFGVGEAGAFPIATRSLSRWMLPTERGYAQGITHAGSRLGAALTPTLVGAMIVAYSWRMPFYTFGCLGIIWAAVWYWYYRDTPDEHKSVNSAELELLHSSLGGPKTKVTRTVPWGAIFASRTLWVLTAMYFCYGWCQAVYIDWFPTYLTDHRGLKTLTMGFYSSVPLLGATLGDFFGGWISDRLAHRTGNLKMARRAVAVCGFLVAAAGIIPATLATNVEACVAFSFLALFGLEVTVGVSWAVPLDIGGDFAGSVSSVMNMAGNIGGAISTLALGYLIRDYGWNVPFFVAAAFCTLGAILFARLDASRRIFG